MPRVLVLIAKWILIILVCYILLNLSYIACGLFILTLLWIRRRKKRRLIEAVELRLAELANVRLEEFEVIETSGENEDGKERQGVMGRCYRGDAVTIKLIPNEGRAPIAEVWTKFGMIGFLAPYDVAQHLELFQIEENPTGEIKKLTGGTEGKPELGCIVSLRFTIPTMDQDDDIEKENLPT